MVSGWITCKAVFGKLVSIVSWLVWKNTTLTLVNAISGFCSKRSGSNLGNSRHQEPPQSQQQASLFCIRIGDWVLERKLMAFISQTIWSKNTILHFSLLNLSFCQVHLYAPLHHSVSYHIQETKMEKRLAYDMYSRSRLFTIEGQIEPPTISLVFSTCCQFYFQAHYL